MVILTGFHCTNILTAFLNTVLRAWNWLEEERATAEIEVGVGGRCDSEIITSACCHPGRIRIHDVG